MLNISDSRLSRAEAKTLGTENKRRLEELLAGRQHLYLLLDEDPGRFAEWLTHSGLKFNNAAALTPAATNYGAENPDALQKFWDAMLKDVSAAPSKSRRLVVVLPRIRSKHRYMDLFNQIRTALLEQWAADDTPKLALCGDHLTLEQMSQESGLMSGPGRELLNQEAVWMFEEARPGQRMVDWLSGGERRYLEYLLQRMAQADEKDLNARLRQAVHALTATLIDPDNPLSLYQRLCWVGDKQGAREDELKDYLTTLRRFLPGQYDISNTDCGQLWQKQRDGAKWRRYDLLHSHTRALVAGGLLRYGADESGMYLRLRSPLLAFAVTYESMKKADWRPGSQRIYNAMTQPWKSNGLIFRNKPSGLDLFLDAVLEKALGRDSELDYWTTPNLDAGLAAPGSKATPGEWWKRLNPSRLV